MNILTKLLLMLCFLVVSCRDSSSEGYKYISGDFLKAIANITPEYFFNTEPPKEDVHEGAMARHHVRLGESLCQPIAESYDRIVDKGIAGKDAYAFDEELTRVMREAGAYVLPLRVTDGLVEATYFNPHWDREIFANLYYGLPQHERLANGLRYEDNGVINITARATELGGDYNNFSRFYDMAVKQNGFKVQKFDSSFDFIHAYLFVFVQNIEDVSQERIFYYVDLPFRITGHEYGAIDKLGKFTEGLQGDVKCHVLSTSTMFQRGKGTPLRFVEQGRAVASITDVEPLTIPLHKEYAMNQVPRQDGQLGLMKNDGYEVLAADMAEPSLKCWLLAFGYIQGDYAECQNTGYAKEFMNMLNSNICVWKDKTTYAPKVDYPYTVNAGMLIPDHANGIIGFINRCSPEPYLKN